jgi:hypothetical protein
MTTALLSPPGRGVNGGRGETIEPERIAELANTLALNIDSALKKIEDINDRGHVLSLNARIEAATAGDRAGAAFGVVAQEMQQLSQFTAQVVNKMTEETKTAINELQQISALLATSVRGARLADLALTCIDLIDRNLYERSCDVRWWATDNSLVDALASDTDEVRQFASRRMGVILSAYTVYYDLVLCDADGNVVANGRPDKFRSIGTNQAQTQWFRSAMASASGEQFGFQTVNESPLVNNQRVLVYSCGVRERGDAHGKLLGVLGIVFNWDALAQTIVNGVSLPDPEKNRTRVSIVDDTGFVLADSAGRQLHDRLNITEWPDLSRQKKGFIISRRDNSELCIAHAISPGFETYATGWHAVVQQSLAE